MVVVSTLTDPNSMLPRARPIQARFHDASRVYLMATFNNWSTTATPMSQLGHDLWAARVPRRTNLEEVSYFVWNHGDRFGQIREPIDHYFERPREFAVANAHNGWH